MKNGANRGILARGIMFLFFILPAFGDDDLIAALGHQVFEEREEAIMRIVESSLTRKDEIIRKLLQAEKNSNPEISRRAATALEHIFLRHERGYGAPQTGLVIKSKIVTIRSKLGTRPLVAGVEKGSPAEKSGLKKGDLILSVNGIGFEGEDGTAQLTKVINGQVAEASMLIRYSRRIDKVREEGEVTLTLAKPKPMPSSFSDELGEFNQWKQEQEAAGHKE